MPERTSNTHAHVEGALESTYGDKSGLTTGFNWPLTSGDGFTRIRDRLPNEGLPGVGPNASVGVRQRAEGSLAGRMDYNTTALLLAAFLNNTETDAVGNIFANFFFPQVALNSVFWNQFLGDVESDVVGAVCTSWGLSMSNDEPLRFSSTWLAKAIDAFAHISDPTVDVYDDSVHAAPIKPSQMTDLTIGSVTLVDATTHLVSGLSLEVDQGAPGDDYGFGVSARSKPVRRAKMGVTLTLDLPIWDDEFWKISDTSGVLATFIADGSAQVVTAKWNNGLAGDNENELLLRFPAMVVTGEMPDAANAGVLPAQLTLTAENGTIGAGALDSGGASNTAVTNVPMAACLLGAEDAGNDLS